MLLNLYYVIILNEIHVNKKEIGISKMYFLNINLLSQMIDV